jgi:hypothetical protein
VAAPGDKELGEQYAHPVSSLKEEDRDDTITAGGGVGRAGRAFLVGGFPRGPTAHPADALSQQRGDRPRPLVYPPKTPAQHRQAVTSTDHINRVFAQVTYIKWQQVTSGRSLLSVRGGQGLTTNDKSRGGSLTGCHGFKSLVPPSTWLKRGLREPRGVLGASEMDRPSPYAWPAPHELGWFENDDPAAVGGP